MENIFEKLANELNLSKETVENTYKAYWKFIREKITSLVLKKNMTKEDFNKLKTNFNLPSLGKLSCTYDRWEKVRKANQTKIDNTIDGDEYKKDKTDV